MIQRQDGRVIDEELTQAVDALFPTYLHDPLSLAPVQQAVLDAWVLSGVVGNGGFDAWTRSNGHRAVETVNGLRLLGQEALAEVVAAAHAIIGNIISARDADAVVDGLSEEDLDRLDALSEKVWSADDSLEVAMVRAVRSKDWRTGP